MYLLRDRAQYRLSRQRRQFLSFGNHKFRVHVDGHIKCILDHGHHGNLGFGKRKRGILSASQHKQREPDWQSHCCGSNNHHHAIGSNTSLQLCSFAKYVHRQFQWRFGGSEYHYGLRM